ncbi:MAG: hypothetical protein RLZZ46_1037 [Bacteroidota bacterium]
MKKIPENGQYLDEIPVNEADELRKAVIDYSKNKDWAAKTKRRPPLRLDEMFAAAHDKVFGEIDCLNCAHCCKTTSPIVTQRDVDRLSKGLKMRPSDLIEKYLTEDGSTYVMKKAPCPFLGSDNYCSVYQDRPSACREYPHTNRRRMSQILDISLNNTFVCPAVARIFSMLRGT